MSSLTQYTVKVKEEFILDAPVPPAALEAVSGNPLDFVPTLEDEILAAAASDASGDQGTGDGALISTLASACASPRAAASAQLPCIDAADADVSRFAGVGAGRPEAIRLALALRGAGDEAAVLQFCAAFDKCRAVLPNASNAEIAAALLAEEDEQAAVNSLLSSSSL